MDADEECINKKIALVKCIRTERKSSKQTCKKREK